MIGNCIVCSHFTELWSPVIYDAHIICNKSGRVKWLKEAHVCIQMAILPQGLPACRPLFACWPWGASERHCNPLEAFLGGSKPERFINCLMQKVCHNELGPHNYLITLSAPPPLFYSTLPPVKQYPSAGTSVWALGKKREGIWCESLSGPSLSEKILRGHELNLKPRDWSKQAGFCHLTTNTK